MIAYPIDYPICPVCNRLNMDGHFMHRIYKNHWYGPKHCKKRLTNGDLWLIASKRVTR